MKVRRLNLLYSIVLAATIVFAAGMGCGGVDSKKLAEAQVRLTALEEQGAPQSLTSEAKLLMIQVQGAVSSGRTTSETNSQFKKMLVLIEKAEKEFSVTKANIKPFIDSLVSSIKQRKQGLSGYQLKDADSLIAILDSIIKLNQLPLAKNKAMMIDTAMEQLIKDEQKAREIRPKVIGTWNSVADVKSEGADAVEKKKLVIKADGSLELDEQLKGKTSQVRKEDWRFLSWGTWGLKGDSVLMFIKREKCLKQDFWNLEEKNGKLEWVKWTGPTYDTVITDGKKDRYMTYQYITENFSRK